MQRRFAIFSRFGILFLLAVYLYGCGDESNKLIPLDDNAIILAFGDSLTEGTGAQKQQSYPAVLAELSGREVINAGIAGELSEAGLARLPLVLTQHQPKLVILCHGGNDLLRKFSTNQLKDNLERMIEHITASGAQLVLLGVPKPSLLLGPASIYREIALEHALVADLHTLSDVLSKARLKSDPVHPNAAGYRKLAEAIHKTLSDAGAY